VVQVKASVERGAKLLTFEVMKMQSNILAPIAGCAANAKNPVTLGRPVAANHVLLPIAP